MPTVSVEDLEIIRPEVFLQMYVMWPLVAQLLLTVLFVPVTVIHRHLMRKEGGWWRTVIATVVGTHGIPPRTPAFMAALYILQIIASLFSVSVFIRRSYSHFVQPTNLVGITDWVCTIFFAFHYWCIRLQEDFKLVPAWDFSSLIDVVTIIPKFFPYDIHGNYVEREYRWLSLQYLRTYRALIAYENLEQTVDLAIVSEVYRKLVVSVLRFIAMIVCMGGTIMVLELLGEIDGYEDYFVATEFGDISFLQICYWMVTTVTTVGYGDFAPKTVLSRFAIVFFIGSGIVFFSRETEQLIKLSLHRSSGRSKYVSSGSNHILVAGTGAGKFTSLIEIFLMDNLTENAGDTPDIVFLSETEYDTELKQFVKRKMRGRLADKVTFLRGSVMNRHDLDRAQMGYCALVFVIPNCETTDSIDEDKTNIVQALQLFEYCDSVQIRLMLRTPESKNTAVLLGIPSTSCFAANQLQASIFAQSTKVKGFITLLSGLTQVTSSQLINWVMANAPKGHEEWMREYLEGLKFTLYGFIAGGKIVGMSLPEAGVLAYKESRGSVLLVAAQVDGQLAIGYEGQLEPGQTVIAIAHNARECRPFADTREDWRESFIERRGLSSHRVSNQYTKSFGMAKFQIASTGRADRRVDLVGRPAKGDTDGPRLKSLSPEVSNTLFPVIIIVLGANAWEDVLCFLRLMFADYLPKHSGVLVMSESSPPERLLEDFAPQGVTFATGTMFQENLARLRLSEASTVAVIVGDSDRQADQRQTESFIADRDVILMGGLIEDLVVNSGTDGDCDCFTVYEFTSTKSVHVFDTATRRLWDAYERHHISSEGPSSSSRLRRVFTEHPVRGPRESVRAVDWGLFCDLCTRFKLMLRPAVRFFQVFAAVAQEIFSHNNNEDMLLREEVRGRLIFHHRFAAGHVFSTDFFGGFLGHIFHFPATIEFVEALTIPGRAGQSRFPWQVVCPDRWVGKTFGDLFEAWTLQQDPELTDCGSALVIAAYRKRSEDGPSIGPGGYNVTVPAANMVLRPSDLLTVLASKEFGALMSERQLLRGVGKGTNNTPSSDPPRVTSPERTTSAMRRTSPDLARPDKFPALVKDL